MAVLRCKVCVVGEATVGKSALIQMFNSNCANYTKNYLMTTGVDLCIKELATEVEAGEDGEKHVVELYIFDISGQDIYHRLIEQYMENMSFFAVVFDTTNKESFDACTKWCEMCRKQRKQLPGVLVAAKKDATDRLQVAEAQAENFAKQNNLQYFATSAARGDNVDGPFNAIANTFARAYEAKLKAS